MRLVFERIRVTNMVVLCGWVKLLSLVALEVGWGVVGTATVVFQCAKIKYYNKELGRTCMPMVLPMVLCCLLCLLFTVLLEVSRRDEEHAYVVL